MRIKQLRAGRGMMTLAKKAHIARVHMARLESGNPDPTLSASQKLAKALKVMVGELVA